MLALLTSRIGIAAMGLALTLLVGGVQQLRVVNQELATASAQRNYERESERARRALEANRNLADQVSTQNAAIEAMASEASKRDREAAARARASEAAAAARRAARPKGQGPEYIAARIQELRNASR